MRFLVARYRRLGNQGVVRGIIVEKLRINGSTDPGVAVVQAWRGRFSAEARGSE